MFILLSIKHGEPGVIMYLLCFSSYFAVPQHLEKLTSVSVSRHWRNELPPVVSCWLLQVAPWCSLKGLPERLPDCESPEGSKCCAFWWVPHWILQEAVATLQVKSTNWLKRLTLSVRVHKKRIPNCICRWQMQGHALKHQKGQMRDEVHLQWKCDLLNPPVWGLSA